MQYHFNEKNIAGSPEAHPPGSSPVISRLHLQIPERPSFLALPEVNQKIDKTPIKRKLSFMPIETETQDIYDFWFNSSFFKKRKVTETVSQPSKVYKIPVELEEGRGCRAWTDREKVFLIGCVFRVLFQTGSLCPTKSQREVNYTCWDRIKYLYDKATIRHTYLISRDEQNLKCQTRTKFAMKRHFKLMKSQVDLMSLDNDDDAEFSKLYSKWRYQYNVDNILTCSDTKFLDFVEKFKK